MIIDESNYLIHYGILRRSGRYPWGSGGNVVTRSRNFIDYISELEKQGLSQVEIARGIGAFTPEPKGGKPKKPVSTTELRALKSIAKNAIKQSEIAEAQRLADKGWSVAAISRKMEKPDSSIRALLAPGAKDKANVVMSIANMLKREVEDKTYIDVGSGVETLIGITDNKKKLAVAMLKEEGYQIFYHKVPQLGNPGKFTTMQVLAPPGVSYSEFYKNRDSIQQISPYTEDKGRSFTVTKRPLPIDPKRVAVRYKEDGGDKMDGIILLRPGVKDLSLGKARYAQVRIMVGLNHFLKGMAMFSNDLPDGVDILFNTNKSRADVADDFGAMKKAEDDPDVPFGAQIKRQITEKNGKGEDVVISVANIVQEEGDWQDWSRNLSSQMLSKQSPALAKAQLRKLEDRYKTELEEIRSLTNPAVRKKLLETYSNSVDSSSVELEAAALTADSRHHVILPLPSLPETQIYAPNYEDGTEVVLIRHPHGGKFEIPRLVVNNKHRESKRILGDARDAVGINHKVAEQLSGADFDGDTVIVIPDNGGKIENEKPLAGLKDFDPIHEYPGYDGMPKIDKQREMGDVSNLITDMTVKGASAEELARAVRHSMVVIDAEKHNLNWKLSAIQNGIPSLKEKYQGGARRGASTLLSRAGAEQRHNTRIERRASEGGPIDPKTGEKVYTYTNESYIVKDKRGNEKVVYRTEKSKKLAETNDAHTLIDGVGTRIERVYANHSNRLKRLANEARLEYLNTPKIEKSKAAAETYKDEVASLKAKLDNAKRNRPLERQANLIAGFVYDAKKRANPQLDKDQLKRERYKALANARHRMGAEQHQITFTHNEWDAIQAGAISDSMLNEILDKADLDSVRKLATPRAQRVVSPAKLARIQRMLASGVTRADIAKQLGIPLGTIDEALYGSSGG